MQGHETPWSIVPCGVLGLLYRTGSGLLDARKARLPPGRHLHTANDQRPAAHPRVRPARVAVVRTDQWLGRAEDDSGSPAGRLCRGCWVWRPHGGAATRNPRSSGLDEGLGFQLGRGGRCRRGLSLANPPSKGCRPAPEVTLQESNLLDLVYVSEDFALCAVDASTEEQPPAQLVSRTGREP